MDYEKRPYAARSSKVTPLDGNKLPEMTREQITSAENYKAKQIEKYPSSQNFEGKEYLPTPQEVEQAKQEMALDFLRRDLSPYFSQKEISVIVKATSNYRHANDLFDNRSEANKPARLALDKIDQIFSDAYNLSQKAGSVEVKPENKPAFQKNILKHFSELDISLLRQAIAIYEASEKDQPLIPNLKNKFEFNA